MDARLSTLGNQSVTLAQLEKDFALVQTWFANNPNGAVLTAARIRVLAWL